MIIWRKSSRSGSTTTQNDCVELAPLPDAVGIRDSKNPGAGHLNLTADQFTGLLANIKADKFSL